MIDNYPKFKLRPITNDEIINSVKIWLDAVKSGLRPTDEDIAHFKGIINFPVSSEKNDEESLLPVSSIEVSETKDGDETTLTPEEKAFEKDRKYDAPKGLYSNKTNFISIERQLDDALDVFL